MKKRTLLISFSALALSLASFAGTPDNMQVWLKNGEQRTFDIKQVDSVTFGVAQQQEHNLLTENTMPPTFAAPIPLEVNAQELAYIKRNNEFGLKCFAKLRETKKKDGTNLPIHFFSPVSLNFALGFCANGASKGGATEIANALGFQSENAVEDMNDFFHKLYLSINSGVDSVDVHTANALWINEHSVAKENFVKTAKESYYATVRNLDFEGDPLGSRDTIIHWAALMTNNRIDDLQIRISELTKLVINNACYFKGAWVSPFAEDSVAEFEGKEGTQTTKFMSNEDIYLNYAETSNYQAVSLDYGTISESAHFHNAYDMVVILPKSGHDLNEVLPTIQWDSIAFKYQKVSLYMPKFKSKDGYDIDTILPNLGINNIFHEFPNAIEDEGIDGKISVSQVRQDFYISVDEFGTEAAAVTSIIMDAESSGEPDMTPPTIMRCNRPFVFAIREKRTGLILFIGEFDSVPDDN